jgi:Protein of unknown function (DUF3617)
MNKRTALLAAAALASPLALSAQTLDLPKQKAGLWEVAVEMLAGMPSMTMQMCIDDAHAREMLDHALKRVGKDCKTDLKRQGTDYVLDSQCTISGMAVKSKTTISGDLGSDYTVRMEGTMDGLPGADKGSFPIAMTQRAKWKGVDCADLKAGEIRMPGGIKVNVKDIKDLKSLPAGGLR